MPKTNRSSPLYGAALLLIGLAVACSKDASISAPTRSFNPVEATVSRDAVPVPGQHIFVMNGPIPSDFAASVEARGGSISADFAEVQAIATAGLSDADAAALAGDGMVANDVTARWAPTPEELHASVWDYPAAPDALALVRSPLEAFFIARQWNMQQIHAPEAWAAGKTGSGSVRVAIIDSGLDPDHQELRGVVDRALSARVVGTTSGTCLFSNSQALWQDDFFHGTYVGSIVSTNDLAIAGVAPNVKLVAVKVLNSAGAGSFLDIICGMRYATLIAHAQVLNMSIGATFKGNTPGLLAFQELLRREVEFAQNHGAVVVAAAGNDDKNLGLPHPFMSLPCEAGTELCVSATSSRDMIARYSNFGRSAIDVAAPGGDAKHLSNTGGQDEVFAEMIIGACSSHAPAICGGGTSGYIFADGTSGAAPHVSGLAALLASQGGTFNPDVAMSVIRQMADDIGNQSKFGDGRINVARALGVIP
jgi:subtilisin family serine protease